MYRSAIEELKNWKSRSIRKIPPEIVEMAKIQGD